MRITEWKFKPKATKGAFYPEDLARAEGLKYIEQLKKEDLVIRVDEESNKFIIYLYEETDGGI